jgi:hypothetical protein
MHYFHVFKICGAKQMQQYKQYFIARKILSEKEALISKLGLSWFSHTK